MLSLLSNIDVSDWPFAIGSFIGLRTLYLRLCSIILTTRVVRNWYELLELKLGLKKSISVLFSTGQVLEITRGFDWHKWNMARRAASKNKKIRFLKRDWVSFDFIGRRILFLGDNIEQFFDEDYSFLDCKGRTVVDIGANDGDTAIYFWAKGAAKVIAFEPYPNLCRRARKNFKANGTRNVDIVNAGLAEKGGEITISENFQADASQSLTIYGKGKKVKILALSQVVGKYSLKGAVLKSDCECYEYGILLKSSDQTLAAFDQVILEYHSGYRDLRQRLTAAGFSVAKIGRPFYSYYKPDARHMMLGLLYAKR